MGEKTVGVLSLFIRGLDAPGRAETMVFQLS